LPGFCWDSNSFNLIGFLVTEPSAPGHFNAATFVHTKALGRDDFAHTDHLFDVLSAAFGKFGDMDEAVLTGKHFHERTESGDGDNLACVNLADFDFACVR
jgi:hypothetical protein